MEVKLIYKLLDQPSQSPHMEQCTLGSIFLFYQTALLLSKVKSLKRPCYLHYIQSALSSNLQNSFFCLRLPLVYPELIESSLCVKRSNDTNPSVGFIGNIAEKLLKNIMLKLSKWMRRKLPKL